MPTLRASSNVRRAISQPVTTDPAAPIERAFAPPITLVPQSTAEPSAFMQGSLPPQASGADVYVRQFYRGGPRQRRFMPVTL